jgi:hypothetical protein
MAWLANVQDPVPGDFQHFLQLQPHVRVSSWETGMLRIPASQLNQLLYVRSGPVPSGADSKTYDVGSLLFSFQGVNPLPGGTSLPSMGGQLEVAYTVELVGLQPSREQSTADGETVYRATESAPYVLVDYPNGEISGGQPNPNATVPWVPKQQDPGHSVADGCLLNKVPDASVDVSDDTSPVPHVQSETVAREATSQLNGNLAQASTTVANVAYHEIEASTEPYNTSETPSLAVAPVMLQGTGKQHVGDLQLVAPGFGRISSKNVRDGSTVHGLSTSISTWTPLPNVNGQVTSDDGLDNMFGNLLDSALKIAHVGTEVFNTVGPLLGKQINSWPPMNALSRPLAYFSWSSRVDGLYHGKFGEGHQYVPGDFSYYLMEFNPNPVIVGDGVLPTFLVVTPKKYGEFWAEIKLFSDPLDPQWAAGYTSATFASSIAFPSVGSDMTIRHWEFTGGSGLTATRGVLYRVTVAVTKANIDGFGHQLEPWRISDNVLIPKLQVLLQDLLAPIPAPLWRHVEAVAGYTNIDHVNHDNLTY